MKGHPVTEPQQNGTQQDGSHGRIDAARAAIGDTAHSARETMEEGYRKARAKATSAYDSAVESAEHAVDSARRGARKAGRKTVETVDTAPLAVLIGGLAVGALAGGLLPRSQREAAALAPVGKKMKKSAKAAAKAAKVAGKEQLSAAGLNRDAARTQLSTLFDSVLKALSEASTAAKSEVQGSSKA